MRLKHICSYGLAIGLFILWTKHPNEAMALIIGAVAAGYVDMCWSLFKKAGE